MIMSRCKTKKLNVQYFRLVLLLLIISILSLNVQAKDKPYPGELIDVGSHRLHINCIGNGSPTVVIDSGIGGFSLEWFKIQNHLATDVRVCSYDRAGYGWSDSGPRPRTTARISRELHLLLTEAKIPGPYLLVGHSFGGYNIRYFASEYPELVAGLVFIEASHPKQFHTEEFKRSEVKVSSEKYKRSRQFRVVIPRIAKNYPYEQKRLAYQLMSTMKSRSTFLNESDFMETSAEQVAARSQHQPYAFPVVIITRGKRVWPHNDLGNRREQQWFNLQNDLVNIGLQPDHFLAYNSGHTVHLDQPYLVSNNILFAVEKVRNQSLKHELIKKFDIKQNSHLTSQLNLRTGIEDKLTTTNYLQYSIIDIPTDPSISVKNSPFLKNIKFFP